MDPKFSSPHLDIDGLRFEAGEHRYFVRDEELPGVTRALRFVSDYGKVPPDVLAAKAELGKRVHSLCEQFIKGELRQADLTPDVKGYIIALDNYLIESGLDVELLETFVINRRRKYVGRLDLAGRMRLLRNVHRAVVDLKITTSITYSSGPQTAAYDAALLDMGIYSDPCRRFVCQLRPNGTYRLVVKNDEEDLPTFLRCLFKHYEDPQ